MRRVDESRGGEMSKFLFSYRVPDDYRPSGETGQVWEDFFDSLADRKIDLGHGVIAARRLGNLGVGTRLGGYSMVEADDLEHAAALARGCPALSLGGGVEVGAVPEFPTPTASEPTARSDIE
jgi:hypothetical protein